MPGHADDQCANPLLSMLADLLPERVVAAQDGVRLGPESQMIVGAEEGAGGAEFLPQEFQPLRLAPFGELLPLGNAGRLEQLGHCEIMGTAVLADIEFRKVESEDIEDPKNRPDRLADEALSTHFIEALPENLQIGGNLFGMMITHSGFRDPCAVRRPDLQGETPLDEQHELAPRLSGMSCDDLIAERA